MHSYNLQFSGFDACGCIQDITVSHLAWNKSQNFKNYKLKVNVDFL